MLTHATHTPHTLTHTHTLALGGRYRATCAPGASALCECHADLFLLVGEVWKVGGMLGNRISWERAENGVNKKRGFGVFFA